MTAVHAEYEDGLDVPFAGSLSYVFLGHTPKQGHPGSVLV